MIGSLKGKLLRITKDEVVLDVSGVGYLLQLSARALPSGVKEGAAAEFVVYTDVKENAIVLYGFRDWLEREVFLLLKKVKGIGPKNAMAVVSALGPEGLLQAVGRRDIAQLKSVPGIGKKTAERLLIELGEHVAELAYGDVEALGEGELSQSAVRNQHGVGSLPAQSAASDAQLALEKLGFPRDRATAAVKAALNESQGLNLQQDPGELLRLSLSHL